jgi:hypothetical protein
MEQKSQNQRMDQTQIEHARPPESITNKIPPNAGSCLFIFFAVEGLQCGMDLFERSIAR